jgi:CPA1 family monovalent cation:H+ antiporter
MNLPHRLMVVLEGESLLNDASALMIYRLAVNTVAAGGFSIAHFSEAFVLAGFGSVVAGYVFSRVYLELLSRVDDMPSATVLQFTGTFGVWILAEHLRLSPIVTVVVFAFTAAQRAPRRTAARLRVPSYAVWDTVVFVLNVLAFVLIGLQLRPIFLSLDPSQRIHYLAVAAAILATVILVRFAWVIAYNTTALLKTRYFGAGRWPGDPPPTWAGGVVASWSGMRGVVTLAAAYALPAAGARTAAFPYRDLILLCAFCVVVGTLVIHGLTLRPLMQLITLRGDDAVQREVVLARQEINQAALAVIDGDESLEARVLRRELARVPSTPADENGASSESPRNLRARVIERQRATLLALRERGIIGDDAFHRIEAQLDLAELSVSGSES